MTTNQLAAALLRQARPCRAALASQLASSTIPVLPRQATSIAFSRALKRPLSPASSQFAARSFSNSSSYLRDDPEPPTQQFFTPDSEAEPPPRPRRPWLRVSLWAAGFTGLGLIMGTFAAALTIPPPLPAPDSAESQRLVNSTAAAIDERPLVETLRTRPEWTELIGEQLPLRHRSALPGVLSADTNVNVAGDASLPAGRSTADSFVNDACRGYNGIGVRRVFWNAQEKRLVSLVFLGPGLVGWPGILHGGILATILQECVNEAAAAATLVPHTATEGVPLPPAMTAEKNSWWIEDFQVRYQHPAPANRVYVIKADLQDTIDGESTGKTIGVAGRLRIKAVLEEEQTARPLTVADAVCVRHTGPGNPLAQPK